MTKAKAMKWSELKEFANTLTDEQLNQDVIVWGEDRGFEINSASTLGEEFIITDEGAEPISTFDPDDLPEYDGAERLPATTLRLWIDEYEEEQEIKNSNSITN